MGGGPRLAAEPRIAHYVPEIPPRSCGTERDEPSTSMIGSPSILVIMLTPRASIRYTSFMGSSVQLPPPGFDDLSVDEQLEYVEALWDRIAEHPERVPVPDWHRQVIRERLAADSPSRPWDDVRREIEEKLGVRR